MRQAANKIRNLRFARLVVIAPLILLGLFYFSRAYGAELPNRSVQLSDSKPGISATYQLSFDIPGAETLGSIKLQFCGNSPILSDPCTAPAGFDASSAALSAQNGEAGFSVLPSGTDANTITLSRVPAAAAAGSVSYTLDGVVNPSSNGTFYGRLQTFASNNASGLENDHGGVAMSIQSVINIDTVVPPFLLFCSGVTIGGFDCSTASGSYINFGDIASSSTKSAESQMVTATNAQSGYAMQVTGLTMTSGNNVINAMAVRDISRPGVSQFGLNLVANQTPLVGSDPQGPGNAAPTSSYSTANFFKFVPGDVLASASLPQDYRKFTVSYILNIPNGQTPGVYVSTLTYVCLANF